jgi:formylglycine-generating enzyme required for sulfatase activity
MTEVNSRTADTAGVMTADGLMLVIASNRNADLMSLDLWQSRRKDLQSPFESPVDLGPLLNTKYAEFPWWFSADGRSLLFVSRDSGQVSKGTLWLAERPTRDAPFGQPRELKLPANIEALGSPAFSATAKLLFLSLLRPDGYGEEDIWVSRRVPKASDSKSQISNLESQTPPRAATPADAAPSFTHDFLLLGGSVMKSWGRAESPPWRQAFGTRKSLNLARTENTIRGATEDVAAVPQDVVPRIVAIHVGSVEIVQGDMATFQAAYSALIAAVRKRFPRSAVVVAPMFTGEGPEAAAVLSVVHDYFRGLADDQTVFFLDHKGLPNRLPAEFFFDLLKPLADRILDGPAEAGTPTQAAAGDGWVSLFNGQDLAGWKPRAGDAGSWRVEGGVLKGTGGTPYSYFVSDRGDWGDFHLRVETRINADGSAGVTCRAQSAGTGAGPDSSRAGALGYLAKINASSTRDARRTGGLYVMESTGFQRGNAQRTSAVKADEWFTLEVIAEGDRIVIQVNGDTITDFRDDQQAFTAGHLALQAFHPESIVEFRKIEIRELGASPAPPPAVAPFDGAAARAHQEAWAKHLGISVRTTNSVAMQMILIPPGEFVVGSDVAEADAVQKSGRLPGFMKVQEPQYPAKLTRPFLCGATEVTIGQFSKFVADTGYKTEAEKLAKSYTSPGYPTTAETAATYLTWNDAAAYCNWLSNKDGLQRVYEPFGSTWTARPGNGYRLPTEAEWEFACRAGTTTQFSFGDDEKQLSEFAWTKENSDNRAQAVGTKAPNPFGLYDMHGNVWEWCDDWYAESPQSVGRNDPRGPASGTRRVCRSGAYAHVAPTARSAFRIGMSPSYSVSSHHGFRVARSFDMPTPSGDPAQPSSP